MGEPGNGKGCISDDGAMGPFFRLHLDTAVTFPAKLGVAEEAAHHGYRRRRNELVSVMSEMGLTCDWGLQVP